MQTLNQTPFSEIKTHFQKVVQRVRRRPVEIIYNGKPAAVLISRSEYKRVQELAYEIARQEDEEDIALIKLCEVRMKEPGGEPLERVMEEFKSEGKIFNLIKI